MENNHNLTKVLLLIEIYWCISTSIYPYPKGKTGYVGTTCINSQVSRKNSVIIKECKVFFSNMFAIENDK